MKLFLVLFFVACTAFFVAAEYSIIRSRMSRIEQMVAEGNGKALAVKNIVTRLDEYLSACQLGNTLTNLVLGWLGESTIERLLEPLFHLLRIPASATAIVSFLIAFFLLTFLEVVVGELAPKMVAIQKAEPLALLLAKPLTLFFKITYPFSWFLNRSAQLITGLFGIKPMSDHEATHSEAELRLILSEGYKNGIINPSEFRYVTNIFELDEMVVKGIMVPRMEMECCSKSDSIEEFIAMASKQCYDYYPVMEEEDKDHIAGMISTKEVLTATVLHHRDAAKTVADFIRPVARVIETETAQDLLLKMQKENVHLAILQDEFGGTSGLVTMRDIIRKIIEEQPYAMDSDGSPMAQKLEEGHYSLSGKMLLSEVNRLLKTDIEDDGIYTFGGWLLNQKDDIRPNDRISGESYDFIVTSMEERKIKRVEAVARE